MTADALAAVIDENEASYRDDLFDLLAQPSVNSTGEGMVECASLLSSILERRGFDAVQRIETEGHPIVYAERIVDEYAVSWVAPIHGHPIRGDDLDRHLDRLIDAAGRIAAEYDVPDPDENP